jgi:hypothetical protein
MTGASGSGGRRPPRSRRSVARRAPADRYRAGYMAGWMDALNAFHCMTLAQGEWERAYTHLANHHDDALTPWHDKRLPRRAPPRACLKDHNACGLRALGPHCPPRT